MLVLAACDGCDELYPRAGLAEASSAWSAEMETWTTERV